MTLTLRWEITDQEYAALRRHVAAEGNDETVEAYAARVGLKGLRGTLETQVADQRRQTIGTVVEAFDSADHATQDAALDALGFVRDPDGTIVKKDAPSVE